MANNGIIPCSECKATDCETYYRCPKCASEFCDKCATTFSDTDPLDDTHEYPICKYCLEDDFEERVLEEVI